MANNITEVRLLSVPLENDYKHTLYFENPTAQANYFIGKTVYSRGDFSYQRKESVIRYPKHYDELAGCNYVMYKNSEYSSRWFYAFITDKTYINDERTDIHIETDVIQTYLFDYVVKPSFIEREHVNDDTIGKHTYPENLEHGEYICEHQDQVTELVDCSYVIGATERPTGSGEFADAIGGRFDGIYSGIWYGSYTQTEVSDLNSRIAEYAEAGKADAIKCLFMYPTALITRDDEVYPHSIVGSEKPKEIRKTFTRFKVYNGYKPSNNKLYTFPYQYLLVSNNNGGSAVYQFEYFTNPDEVLFYIRGCITPGGSIRALPTLYKGSYAENDIEGLNLGKYPICNWSSDEYTNWLTQNSVNIGLNLASGVGQIIGGTVLGVATGGAGGAIGGGTAISGVSTIANQLAQIHQMSFAPPQNQGNVNCGDVITADGANTFTFMQMRIRDEYLEIIDNFFSMFGYKCNKVKTPLKNHRSNYWYTKTIDVSIDGNIPNKDMQTIKNCYNNGITFWKNPDNIGNYSVSNTII